MSMKQLALVVGGTGIAGRALCRELAQQGRRVVSLSRSAPAAPPAGVETVRADLTDAESVAAALAGLAPTHIFFTAWSRRPTEAENIAVNAAMVRHVLDAAGRSGRLRHVALVTGIKHYLGPFEEYAAGARDTPFRESEPRLPVPNFYYAQEDELWEAAERHRFTWSVHRSHTIIGHAVGNHMNMGMTLAVQAALSRAEGTPFVFPGNEVQWNGITDMTDADLLARQLIWAATTDGLPSQAYNTANGDVFRWRRMWPRIAELLKVEPEGYAERPRPLEHQMSGRADAWRALAARENLAEPDITRVASWWHTDADLNRPVECFTDLTRSRTAGFTGHADTLSSFAALFDTLRRERVIPA
ncbi:SDR family oxidoreductase [Streptomyces amakusaensis]|uniref:SDR family oxidoreductase n=1 Tax=Streptomyces amakusaensis TaxID=67271 RepID=A0ABW0AF96_9ACTN